MERLPSWAAGMGPVGFSWNASAEAARNNMPNAAASTGHKDGLQLLQERPKSNASCWTANSAAAMSSKVSDNSTQDFLSADRQEQCWDPTPSMPDMAREEAMELMNDYGLVDQSAAEARMNEGAAGLSRSAPTTSEIDSVEGDDSKGPHDDKFSRARSQPYTAEQKQVKARESQKRFRMRQKARFGSLMTHLWVHHTMCTLYPYTM